MMAKTKPTTVYSDTFNVLANSFVWMDALEKHDMFLDLFEELLTFLSDQEQLAVVRSLFELDSWEGRFSGNSLMDDVRYYAET